MKTVFRPAALLAAIIIGVALPAAAQSVRPAPSLELHTGYAGFVDEVWIKRTMIGGAGRAFVSPRVAVGPEFLYLDGRDGEHDWTLMGTVTFDVLRESASTRVIPFVVAGAGMVRQTALVGTGFFTSRDPTFSGGGGVRILLGRRWFVAPEVRLGFEPTMRIGVTVGVR
jgi:hypothetical protein